MFDHDGVESGGEAGAELNSELAAAMAELAAEQARVDAVRAAWVPVVDDGEPVEPEVVREQAHAALDALLDARRTDPGAALGGVLIGWDQLQRSIDGALVGAVAGFATSAAWALDAYRSPTAWMVAALGLKRAAAGSLRRVCTDVAAHPTLAEAAARGRLSLAHLRALLDARVDPLVDQFDLDAAGLAAEATTLTVDALVRRLEQWRTDALAELERNEPDGPEPDDPTTSTCRITELLWGRARVELDLDPATAALIKNGLDHEYETLRRAGALDHDPRTLREIHADLFTTIFARGLTNPTGLTPTPHITAVVDLDTLLHRAGTTNPTERTTRIAHITGHGPVTDRTIAELAAQANLSLLVTHPVTGEPLWLGRTRRLATPAQRTAVIATSTGHCNFPGCTIPATRCELDHLHSWHAGGTTDINNLQLLCPFHNRLKHRWNLHTQRHPDGTTTWTHPNGTPIEARHHTTPPPPRPGQRPHPPGPTDP